MCSHLSYFDRSDLEGIEDEIEEKYGLEDQNEQDNSRISLFEEAEKVQNGISFNENANNVNCQMLIDEHAANQDFQCKADENMDAISDQMQDQNKKKLLYMNEIIEVSMQEEGEAEIEE